MTNSSDRESIASWAGQVRTISSWLSGVHQRKALALAESMEASAGIEAQEPAQVSPAVSGVSQDRLDQAAAAAEEQARVTRENAEARAEAAANAEAAATQAQEQADAANKETGKS